MMEKMKDILSDVGFLVHLASVAAATIVAFWTAKMLLDLSVRKDDKIKSNISLFVRAFRGPLYSAIALIGGVELVVGLLDRIQPAWVVQFRSIQSMIILLLVFVVLYRLISVVEHRFLDRAERMQKEKKDADLILDPGAIRAFGRVMKGVILVIAGLSLMSNLGIRIEGLLAFGGIGTIMIGILARETLANHFSGLVIFMDRPFDVGDWVRIQALGVEGMVETIGWRITCVRSFDQRPLYVPNSLISANVIENPQRMLNRRIYEYIGLRYDDIGVLKAVVDEVRNMLRNHPEIDHEQMLMVNFDRYGDFSIDFFIYAMTVTKEWTEYHEVKEDVLFRIAKIVEKHGAEFAFPTRTLHHLHPQGFALPEKIKD